MGRARRDSPAKWPRAHDNDANKLNMSTSPRLRAQEGRPYENGAYGPRCTGVPLMDCWPSSVRQKATLQDLGPSQGPNEGPTRAPNWAANSSPGTPTNSLKQQREVGEPGRFRLLPVRVLSYRGPAGAPKKVLEMSPKSGPRSRPDPPRAPQGNSHALPRA